MNALKHFKTITEHKIWVMRHCFKTGLYIQGLLHDMSKYMPTEFLEGCKYYQGYRSPNNRAREDKGWSDSWLHHKGRNKHHFEYWIDYGLDSPTIIRGVDMPRKYIAEMFMDRVAACKTYNREKFNSGDPYKYFMKSKKKLWFVSPKTKRDLERLLLMYAEKGEDYTFRFIKNVYLKKERKNKCKK